MDDWPATMSAHESRTGMVGGQCHGGTCGPERGAIEGDMLSDWQLGHVLTI